METLAKLQRVDRRVIYTMVFIVLTIPLFKPIGLPIPVTRETQKAFDTMDSLPADSIVLFTTSIGPSGQGENEPQTVAVIKHTIKKGYKIVFAPMVVDSPRYVMRYRDLCLDNGYIEGEDFIVLPFMAGGETAFASVGQDIRSLYSNQPSSPLWDSIESASSIAAIVDIGGGEHQRWAIAHIKTKHPEVHIVPCITAVILAVTQPYFTSGQMSGIISGMNGAAEYEFLAKVPGKGASGMDAQSLGHLWIAILVLVGNIGYFASLAVKKRTGGGN